MSQCKINTSGLSIFHPNVGDYNAPYASDIRMFQQIFDTPYDVTILSVLYVLMRTETHCFQYKRTMEFQENPDKPLNYLKEIRFTDQFGA
jgi:hypothetical protein